ncbi:hypothetical protein GF312_22010 [Candidatus Poribacteria bacterium]|nr:hypothetical protein [Candidatus Poribacteria bacterium]
MAKPIYLPKWTELVMILHSTPPEQRYCGKLHRRTGMTIRHLRNLMSDLEDMKIIEREGKGKIKYITLTETGKQLAELFLQVYPALKR